MVEAADVQPFFHAASGTWSYLVSRGNDAVVVDPVLDFDLASGRAGTEPAQVLLDVLEARRLVLHLVLETHAHADHLSAAAVLRARTGAAVAIGAGIRSVQAHFAPGFGWDADAPALAGAFDRLLHDGDVVDAGALRIGVMALPGHTADSLGYRIGDDVFVGDTLFAPDVGTARCDFPGGDSGMLHASLARLHAMPPGTRLWLCHDYPPAGRAPCACVTVESSARDNRMCSQATSLEAFAAARQARDATLPPPRLLQHAMQANLRGGWLPPGDTPP